MGGRPGGTIEYIDAAAEGADPKTALPVFGESGNDVVAEIGMSRRRGRVMPEEPGGRVPFGDTGISRPEA